jgi:diaminopimelate decarboxylase
LGVRSNLSCERLPLFPDSTSVAKKDGISQLVIAGISTLDAAKEYGTPLYIYDRQTMDDAVQSYREALKAYYPGKSGLTYAGKAFLCLAVAEWAKEQEIYLDCTGAIELELAVLAGLPRKSLIQHGVSKSRADMTAAIHKAGIIVIDNLCELDHFLEMPHADGTRLPEIWLRLRPGLDVETHAYTQTGGPTSKFGLSQTEFECAVARLIDRGIPPKGLHFHLGSQFNDPAPVSSALNIALDLIASLLEKYGWCPEILCPGGGWGVPYHESDLPHKAVAEYVGTVCDRLISGCEKRNLNLPHLQLEPGRSLTAKAGVAIYQVQAVKNVENRRWLLVDGGLADNPRPALYQARYTALPVSGLERPFSIPAWIGGPYCESSDILIQELPLPEMKPGEFLAVPVSGAYQLSMSSNYNGALKPGVIWLEDGSVRLIRRRETLGDLLQRDFFLHG